MHKVTAGPDEEGMEPGGERFNGVVLAMPHCVSLCIHVDNVRGLIRALLFMVPGNSSVFQLLDPLGRSEDSIAEGNVEVGHPPIVLDVSVGSPLEYIFVVFDAVVEPADLLFEAVNFAGFLGITLGNGCKEPFRDGLENVGVEVGVGCQGGCNGTGRHRWFRTLDQSDWERDSVFGRQGIREIDRTI